MKIWKFTYFSLGERFTDTNLSTIQSRSPFHRVEVTHGPSLDGSFLAIFEHVSSRFSLLCATDLMATGDLNRYGFD